LLRLIKIYDRTLNVAYNEGKTFYPQCLMHQSRAITARGASCCGPENIRCFPESEDFFLRL